MRKLLSLALTLTMAFGFFPGLGASSVLADDAPVFPAIYPADKIMPLDWDDPQLDALAWGVVKALTTAELYDMQGGSNTSRGRNTGNWEDSYTWGTGYVHMAGALGVPVMRFWDGPQGVVTVGHFDTTLPPSEPAAASTWDRDAMYKYGTSYGWNNKASSANVQLGSQIDVIRSTHFTRSRDTLSEDAYLGSELAAEFVKGMEDQNVSATLKHVAGYNFNTGTNRDVRVDEQTFHENWMAAPRKAIVEGGASSIMTSYNRINLPFFDTWNASDAPKFFSSQPNTFNGSTYFPQVGSPNPNASQAEKDYPLGYQAAWNTYLLKDTLRDMYGFQGLTMTDWGGNTAFSGFSGTTLETGTINRNNQTNFEEAIARGYGTLDDVKKNAYYNLKAIGKIGYLGLVQLDSNGVAIRGTIDGGYNSIELAHPLGQEREDILWASEALNLDVEAKGAVLLKNSDAALPLKDAADKKVAVIGLSGQYALTSHYSEASAGWVQAKFSPLEKLQEMMPNSDVRGYIGVNDIVGEPIPAELLWSEIERPTQPEFSGDFDGVTAGVNFTVADYPDGDNPVTKVLPDIKVLTGTNDYKNDDSGNGNGIPLGKSGSVTTYLKAPDDGTYGFKLLAIGGAGNGNIRISLLGEQTDEVESFTNINLTTTTFGRGTGAPAGAGYGTTNEVAARNGMNIPAAFNAVNLIKDRWYKIEINVRPVLNAKDAQFQLNWLPDNTTAASRAAAVAAAGVPDTDVVFFAHQRNNGGSAASETTNTLAADQLALLEDVSAAAKAVGNKVIFVGNISLAISMPWLDKVDAVLWMWLGGDMIGTATAQLLTGVVNPSGKTTITFPKDSQQSQFGNTYVQNGNVASPGTYSVYAEGIYGGYKWYDWQNEDGVLFPFGYGLSYTTFEYSNLEVVPTPGANYGYTVSVDVENTGDVSGGEAVQVYLSAPTGYVQPAYNPDKIIEEVQIAEKALVQFDKVYLGPGQKQTVTMDVSWEQLMFWDVDAPLVAQPDGTKGKWQPVLGERTFMVGGVSDNLPLSATVVVEKAVNEGEPVAGISAPEILDTIQPTPELSYAITVNNISENNLIPIKTNTIEITAKFDNTKLNYVGSDVSPTLSNIGFIGEPTYNAATGEFKASISKLQQGAFFDIETPTELFTIKFTAKAGVADNDQIRGEIKSVIYYAMQDDGINTILNGVAIDPDNVLTQVSGKTRFDINKDGKINMQDISAVIYNYFLMKEGGENWNNAKSFDANYDGIVDMTDLLIICSYFT
jgi:beta-glucosidase